MHYFFRDQWFGTDEEVRAHIPEGEPVNPAGSFIWLKLDSPQTLLHRKVSLNDLCLALILLEDIFRIVPPLLKCVLSHIKCPKTSHPTFTLPCSSHLSPLLYFIRFPLSYFLFFKFSSFVSCSPPYHPTFPLSSFIVTAAVTSTLPLNNILLSILSLLITKCPVSPFPSAAF